MGCCVPVSLYLYGGDKMEDPVYLCLAKINHTVLLSIFQLKHCCFWSPDALRLTSPLFSCPLLTLFSSSLLSLLPLPSSTLPYSTLLLSHLLLLSTCCYSSSSICILTLTLCLLVPCCRAGERRRKRNLRGLSFCLYIVLKQAKSN